VYSEPIAIDGATTIRTRAYKDGWLSSEVAEFLVFKAGHKPTEIKLISQADDRYLGEGEGTLIDNQKGLQDFYRHPAWMGFRENDLIADLVFDDAPPLRVITLSYVKNVGARFMPPREMQVWAGNDRTDLKLIATIIPKQPTDYESTRIEAINASLPSTQYKYYRVVAKPLNKLPAFRKPKKGEKGWLLVDEIFFN
jgi:hypothetical protein